MSADSSAHRAARRRSVVLAVVLATASVATAVDAHAAPVDPAPAVGAATPISAVLMSASGGTIGCTVTTQELDAQLVFEENVGEVFVDSYTYGVVYHAPITLTCSDPAKVRRARITTRARMRFPKTGWSSAIVITSPNLATDLADGISNQRVDFGSITEALPDLSNASCDRSSTAGRFTLTARVDGVDGTAYRAAIQPPRTLSTTCPLP